MSASNWPNERRSKALIAKLTKDRVELRKCIGVPNDFFILVGKDRAAQHTLKALEARRTRAIEREYGAAFTDLTTSADCYAYLAVDEEAPIVFDVVTEAWRA